MHVRCPHCHNPIELVDDAEFSDLECPSCGSNFSLLEETIDHLGTLTTDSRTASNSIGHFELLKQVGLGAFGSVWKARDTKLDRIVAVKIPRKDQLAPSEAEQFLREARSAAQLKHPNIVPVHEAGRDNGQMYIVSDFIEGLPLSSWLTDTHPTFREAAELLAVVADALHHAHEVGVVHRDLKPSNIMLDSEGAPHIMDFGLAKREAGEITMTLDGKLLGTPAYMSPEQAKGEAHLADRRTDVYSLGVILFELLTGERPFRGDFRMLLHQVLHDDAPSPRKLKATVPRDLETICLKCVEKDVQSRYASAKEVAEELRRFLRGEAVAARPITSANRTWRWCKRNPVVASLLATVAGLLVVLAVAGPLVATREQSLREAETNQRRNTEKQLRIATAMRLAAQSQSIQKAFPVRSLLLAMEAIDVTRRHNEPIVSVAHETLLNTVPIVGGKPFIGHDGPVEAVSISADGRWLVTGSRDKTARLWDLSDEARSESPVVLQGHEGGVNSVAISPDGRWLVTGCADSTARIWDLGKEVSTQAPVVLQGHDRGISEVIISPSSHWLLTQSYDKAVRWDLTAENPTETGRELQGHAGLIETIAVSPDSRWAATGSRDKTARLWELSAADPSESSVVLPEHQQMVNSVTFGPDSRWLFTGTGGLRGRTGRLWDLTAEDRVPIVLQGHDAYITSAAISKDGSWLVTGSYDHTARLWNLKAPDPSVSPIVLFGHEGYITSVAISPDSRWLVTGSGDKTARVWDLTTSDPSESQIVLRGHEGNVSSVAITPDGRQLFTGSFDNTARLWDLTSSESSLVLRGHEGNIESIAISPDSRWLVTGSTDSTVRLWDLTADNPNQSPVVLREHKDSVFSVSIGPNGRWLATGSLDRNALLWDLTAEEPAKSAVVLPGHQSTVMSMAISPDGHWLATVGGSTNRFGEVRLWDLTDEDPASSSVVMPGHEDSVMSVKISADSRWLATGSYDRTARIWDLTAEAPVNSGIVLRGHEAIIPYRCIAISPNSRWLATGSNDNTARLWDLTAESPSDSPVVLEHPRRLAGVAISPDGHWLVTGCWDNNARLWDLSSENPAASPIVLRGHDGIIRADAVLVSPDGRWVITGSSDNTIRLWELDNPKKPPLVLRGHTEQVWSAAISSDGRWLATAGYDGTARLWEFNIDSLIERARRLAGRELTEEERETYYLDGVSLTTPP